MFVRRAAGVLVLIVLGAMAAAAQTVSGTLAGRVVDPKGSVVPGATVEALEESTGAQRATVTNEAGLYRLPFLPIGRYRVTVTLPGFVTIVRPGIEVSLNATTTLDLQLSIASQSATVTVTAAPPQIDVTSGELKSSFDEQQIEDKPILNRDMLNLVNDVPGFQANAVSGQNNPTASSGSSVQINGTGTRAATFQTDGINNDDSSENQHRQRVNISSIREFQVLRNSFTAEFGRGAGAVVLVQTKNGTNRFHGDGYWYTQNNVLNAQSYFGNLAGARKAAVHRHIWGGTVGGPILRNRLFFFQSFERVIDKGSSLTNTDILFPEERSVDATATNLSASDRAWILSIIDRFPNAQPNSPALGPRVYTAFRNTNVPDQDYGTRVDVPLRRNQSLFFRYQFSGQIRESSDNIVRGEATRQDNRQQSFGTTYTHTFDPRTVGEFRFALGRRRTTVNLADGNETPTVRFSDLSRGTTLGSSTVYPILRYQTDFQYVYNLSRLVSATNALRVGTDMRRQQLNDRADQSSRGFWTFAAAQGFNSIQNLRRGFVSSYQRSWGPNYLGNRSGELNYYVQDDWKARRNLTLNFGARFEHVLRLTEVNDRLDYGFGSDTYVEPRAGFAWSPHSSNRFFHLVTGDPGKFVLRGGAGFFHGRIFQSSLSQNGASIRFNPPNALTQDYANVFGPADPSGGFVFVPGALPTTRYSPTWVDAGLQMPYTEQWNLTVEREFPRKVTLSASYTGNRGIGLLFYDLVNRSEFPIRAADDPRVSALNRGVMIDCIDPNPANANPAAGCISLAQPRTTDRRPDPRYGPILRIFNGSWSYYNGLQVSVLKRYTRGFALNANYTLGKAIDTGSEMTFTGLDQGSSSNGKSSASALRGLSLYNQFHRAVVNYSYRVPFMKEFNPFVRHVLGGWQIAGTTTFSSGNPFTITAGYDVNGDGSSSDRPNLLNPAVLGTSIDNARLDPATGRQVSQALIRTSDIYPNAGTPTAQRVFLPGTGYQGNLGRNNFFTHGANNWDVQFSKGFRIREGHQLNVRMEFYNLTNRIQWAYPNRSALNAENTFLQITGQRNSPRRGQLILRYTF
jgi:outer membrane receptor protein involved in Fe transport